MGQSQIIEVVHDVVILPPPVKKQVWDGEKFVPMTLYKRIGLPNAEQLKWLEKSDRKSTRLNSSHIPLSRMPSSA